MYDWNVKRKTPYTENGIKRLCCARCGEPADCQWQICSDDRLFRPLCKTCDVLLNALVLAWVGHPEAENLIARYALSKSVSLNEVERLTGRK